VAGTTRRRTHLFFTKVKGYVTRKPPIRKLVVKSQAVLRSKLYPRFKTTSKFIKVFGAATITVVYPKKIIVVLQAIERKLLNARIKTKTVFTYVYGTVTRKPAIEPIKVVSQAIERGILSKRIKTKSFFTKAVGGIVVPVAVFPEVVKILGQAVNRSILSIRFKTQVRLTKVFGSVTRNPPIRKLDVKLQAVNRSAISRKIKTRTVLGKAFGGLVFPVIWTEYGAPFLFTVINWTQPSPYFEVYMRAIVGTVFARVFDTTGGVEVPNSELSTALNTFERIRSAELVLADTHIYKLQVGKQITHSGEILSGRLIIV